MKHIVFLFVSALALASASFGQVQPAPSGPVNSTSAALEASWFCPGQDKVWFADGNAATINEVCVNDALLGAPIFLKQQAHILAHIPLVQQIVPINANSFYAFASNGRVYRYSFSNGVPSLYSWRMLGGDAVPEEFSAQPDSIVVRFPSDGERVRMYFYDGAYAGNWQPLYDVPSWYPEMSYSKILRTKQGFEAWLSPFNHLFLPKVGLFSVDRLSGDGIRLFFGESVINAVVSGDSFYVTLGTQNNSLPSVTGAGASANNSEPGKLVRVTPTAGKPKVETLVSAYIDPNTSQSSLGVGARGVYFLAQGDVLNGDYTRGIVVYNFATHRTDTVVGSKPVLNNGNTPYFAAIAVAPSLFPALPTLPSLPTKP
jgi:hypothetical protein